MNPAEQAALLAQTLESIRKSYATALTMDPVAGALAKATFGQPGSAISGINYYDLEAGAKLLYPVLTPLRNMIPRVSGKGGIQANWRAITAINTQGIRLGVSDGNRGGVMAVATADYIAAYKGIGLESTATFEAQYAAQNFDDVRALAALTLLQSVMIGEEFIILGGDATLALGTTPTPSLSAQTSGGGAAKQSAAASATVSGGGGAGSVKASVAAVNGAVAYAWFWGTAGSEKLGAITPLNSYIVTNTATGTQTALSLGTLDASTNSLIFDGLLTQAFKPGSNAYIAVMPTGTLGVGTPLTADNEGGVVEIDTALKAFWDLYRLSPDTIWVNSQEALNIGKKIAAGGTASNLRFTREANDGILGGGIMVKEYLNRFSMGGGQVIPIRIHPNMPAGTILFTTSRLPYPLSNVSNVFQIRTRQEYYQIEWPLRTRKYEYGVYADEVLQHYFPPSLGVITNIGNG